MPHTSGLTVMTVCFTHLSQLAWVCFFFLTGFGTSSFAASASATGAGTGNLRLRVGLAVVPSGTETGGLVDPVSATTGFALGFLADFAGFCLASITFSRSLRKLGSNTILFALRLFAVFVGSATGLGGVTKIILSFGLEALALRLRVAGAVPFSWTLGCADAASATMSSFTLRLRGFLTIVSMRGV